VGSESLNADGMALSTWDAKGDLASIPFFGLPPSSMQQGCFHSVITATSFLPRSWHTLASHNSNALRSRSF
jgi:hypothetical protein